jgi:Transglutaminase-like superfamily
LMAAPSPEPARLADQASETGVSLRGGSRGKLERVRLVYEIISAFLQARRELRRVPIAEAIAGLRSESSPARPETAETLAEARSLGWVVSRTLVHVPGDTRCLARSLVLTRLLARRGISAKLVIGARAAPEFLAHAWVEHAGDPVLDPGDESFGRLVEL